MGLLPAFGFAALVILLLMVLLWLLSLALKDAGIIDSFWGLGFVIVNWVCFALLGGGGERGWLLGALVTLWGLRLSVHIFLRNRGKGEDFRYAKWRREEGPRWWWLSLIRVFLLQGALLLIISAPLPVVHAAAAPGLGLLDILAGVLWLVGFVFEAGGDWQLARFKADPRNKGKVMDRGFWRYSRHPNYFGDAVQWWAYYLFALAAGGWWTLFSPVIMTFLLVRVSGAALLERTLSERPGYREYVQSTNEFFPWFPRSSKGGK